ncbi:Translation initiation factor 3 subunit b [Orbilia ellipsospora]|uniref:Translation initiation factor 3 subunit b n=1 Tax=Orbilia ellipsospora TaxID=2528407 RepID=A0AAV9XQ24_9PEZI
MADSDAPSLDPPDQESDSEKSACFFIPKHIQTIGRKITDSNVRKAVKRKKAKFVTLLWNSAQSQWELEQMIRNAGRELADPENKQYLEDIKATREWIKKRDDEVAKLREKHPTKCRVIYDLQWGGPDDFPGLLARTEGDTDPINTKSVDDCYDNFGITYDFFKEVFNRDSLDNKGFPLIGCIGFRFNYPNACWSPILNQMVFGDGFVNDPENPDALVGFEGAFGGFASALDVIAHELAHGFITYAIPERRGISYMGESGALNESLADVFASMVMQWHNKQTVSQASWLIGETTVGNISKTDCKALRSLKEPGSAFRNVIIGKDPQVGHKDNYWKPNRDFSDTGDMEVVESDEDEDSDGDDSDGEIVVGDEGLPEDDDSENKVKKDEQHVNSGIGNKAFYLAAEAFGGYSWEKAGQIWYNALLSSKLPQGCSFKRFAEETFKVASNVQTYGADASGIVKQAWEKVGIKIEK